MRPKRWSEGELSRLKRLYPSELLIEEVYPFFPERTPNAVRSKAAAMGIKRPVPDIERIRS